MPANVFPVIMLTFYGLLRLLAGEWAYEYQYAGDVTGS
jgi:hypothetical protein